MKEPSTAIGTESAPGSGSLVIHRAVWVVPDMSTPPTHGVGAWVGPLSTHTAR